MNAKPRFFVTYPTQPNPGHNWIDVVVPGQERTYYIRQSRYRGQRWQQDNMSHSPEAIENAVQQGRREELRFCKAMKLLRELGIPLPPKV